MPAREGTMGMYTGRPAGEGISMRLKLAVLGLLAAAAAAGFAQSNTAFDLDVTYIERTPRLDFTSGGGGWPADGQAVQWVAHMHNWGSQAVSSVDYRWTFDGAVVGTGTITNWAAGADTAVAWPWTWEKVRHSLKFELDPASAITGELSRGNNTLTIDTDALGVGAWVEDGLATYMHDNQKIYNDGANSFEDWMQRNMTLWNKMFRDAVYPSSPNGIVDRVRLDEVVHVGNGDLPLAGGIATNDPDFRDHTVDMMWGFPYHAGDVGPGNFYNPVPGSPFQYEWGLIHEMNHARYLIDSYGFDVHSISVQDLTLPNGAKMLGSSAMPYPGADIVRYDKYKGLMDSTHYYSEYEAYEWNRIAGLRARQGDYNAPGDIGVFLNTDLPQANHFRFVDQNLNPIAGATVEVHQSRANDGWYEKLYLQTPDLTYTTDSDGKVDMPRSPFGSYITHWYGMCNSVMLLVVKTSAGVVRTTFVEASDFNLEFWRGHTQDAYYEVQLDTSASNSTLGSVNPGPRARLSGRVVDTAGNPVSGVWVGVHPDGDAYSQTDSAGRWFLSAKVGEPIGIAAGRSLSTTTLYPLSQRYLGTPVPGNQTLSDLVIPNAVPNVVLSTSPVTTSPYAHWLGNVTDNAYPVRTAADQDFGTRWATTMVPATFVTRDTPLTYILTLKTNPVINTLVLHWQSNYARGYRIEIAPNATNFERVYSTDMGTGGFHIPLSNDFRGVDNIKFPARVARTVRIIMTNLNPSVNYASLWEIQAGLDPVTLTMDDAAQALRVASGLTAAAPDDMARLNTVRIGDASNVVDILDAVAVIRAVNGL